MEYPSLPGNSSARSVMAVAHGETSVLSIYGHALWLLTNALIWGFQWKFAVPPLHIVTAWLQFYHSFLFSSRFNRNVFVVFMFLFALFLAENAVYSLMWRYPWRQNILILVHVQVPSYDLHRQLPVYLIKGACLRNSMRMDPYKWQDGPPLTQHVLKAPSSHQHVYKYAYCTYVWRYSLKNFIVAMLQISCFLIYYACLQSVSLYSHLADVFPYNN
jgi:hypothetical protein